MAVYQSIHDVKNMESTVIREQSAGVFVRTLKIDTEEGRVEITMFAKKIGSLAIKNSGEKY